MNERLDPDENKFHDEVLKLAEENGIVIVGEAMVRFANLAYAAGAAAEREACAKIAAAIRARREK